MAASPRITRAASDPGRLVPPLRNGDHLAADEFLRRYEAMSHLKKAELIDGRVYLPAIGFVSTRPEKATMASPVTIDNHATPHFDLIGWLAYYRSATPGIRGADNGTVYLDVKNVPQPDALLFIQKSSGGQSWIGDDDYLHGAPEFIVEIAFSSVSYDLHEKRELYERTGAREYLVWRVEDRAFDWFVLREGRYAKIAPAEDGTLRSEVFPGLRLDPEALIRGDLAAVHQAVRRGLAIPEHAAFVERLQRAATG